jgi:hypothetical protein
MAYEIGTVAYGSTGNKTYALAGPPKMVRVRVGSRFNTSESYIHESIGVYDGSVCMCVSKFQDTTGGLTRNSNSKIVSHYDRIGGAITEVLAASVSFSGNNIIFNVTIPNPNYQLIVETEY